MDVDLAFLPLTALSAVLARHDVSPVEIVEALLGRIDRHDEELRSYITVCADPAKAAARQVEREILDGRRRGPLHGIPIAHKDISLTKGVRTTAHSRTLLEFVPDHDATHVRRLSEAGMILLGAKQPFAYDGRRQAKHRESQHEPLAAGCEEVRQGGNHGFMVAVLASD